MSLDVLTNKIFDGRLEVQGITIDGPNSKDLDDAIWLDSTDDDGYVAHISIADVSSVVKKDSKLDKKALEQGFTHYFLNGNTPMIPRNLSENSLSLVEGQQRPTITISVPITKELDLGKPDINLTSLTSLRKCSYKSAEAMINKFDFLRDAFVLSKALFNKRKTLGALAIFDKTTGLYTDEDGTLKLLGNDERYDSHLLVQEFMILANSAIAEYFAINDIPGLFRNHTVKSCAPKSSNLILDMDAILSQNDPSRVEVLQERLNLIMNKAEYSPKLFGHYALNLPAYMHFTSPIRRYADLVNHMQLSAILQDKNLPFDRAELESIAEHINKLTLEMKNNRNSVGKHKDRLRTKSFIASNMLENLNERDFYRVLKVATRESGPTPEIKNTYLSRLESNKLDSRELYTVLFESNNEDSAWVEIQRKSLDWLENNLSYTKSILNIASSSLGWVIQGFKTKNSSCSSQPLFRSKLAVTVDGTIYESKVQQAYSKKEAEQLATLDVLESILGFESKTRSIKSQSAQISSVNLNPKSILSELCDYVGATKPVYETSQSGPVHNCEFSSVVKVMVRGKSYVSDRCSANVKKKAEQLAAESLLDKLPMKHNPHYKN